MSGPQRRREWAGGLRSVALPVLAVVAIVGAVWCLQRDRGRRPHRASRASASSKLPAANEHHRARPPAGSRDGPRPTSLRTLDGRSVRLSDLRGKVVLVNFWATWCGPCRRRVPESVRVYAEQKDGAWVVAVDLQEADGLVRDFAEEFGMTFPVVFDRTGEVASAYRVRGDGLPTTASSTARLIRTSSWR